MFHTVSPITLSLLGFRIRAQSLLLLVALTCLALEGFALYLQHGVGLEPCPMCIVQRYAMLGVLVLALVGWRLKRPVALLLQSLLLVLMAGFGAFVAARQSWLQWYPPEVVSCGRDFYGMIESFPLGRAIPMIFRGTGDCSKIDWTFLGGTIANWTFVCFSAFVLLGVWIAARAWRACSA